MKCWALLTYCMVRFMWQSLAHTGSECNPHVLFSLINELVVIWWRTQLLVCWLLQAQNKTHCAKMFTMVFNWPNGGKTSAWNFDVLLTVHLSIYISVINQLDAQNFCFIISLFHVCTCFEHMYSSWGGQNCIIQPHHTYGWPSRLNLCTRRPPISVMIPEAV